MNISGICILFFITMIRNFKSSALQKYVSSHLMVIKFFYLVKVVFNDYYILLSCFILSKCDQECFDVTLVLGQRGHLSLYTREMGLERWNHYPTIKLRVGYRIFKNILNWKTKINNNIKSPVAIECMWESEVQCQHW